MVFKLKMLHNDDCLVERSQILILKNCIWWFYDINQILCNKIYDTCLLKIYFFICFFSKKIYIYIYIYCLSKRNFYLFLLTISVYVVHFVCYTVSRSTFYWEYEILSRKIYFFRYCEKSECKSFSDKMENCSFSGQSCAKFNGSEKIFSLNVLSFTYIIFKYSLFHFLFAWTLKLEFLLKKISDTNYI